MPVTRSCWRNIDIRHYSRYMEGSGVGQTDRVEALDFGKAKGQIRMLVAGILGLTRSEGRVISYFYTVYLHEQALLSQITTRMDMTYERRLPEAFCDTLVWIHTG